jgi:urease gamma subunit
MRLTEHERERLLITLAADVAERRRGRGLKLNHPEAVAILTSFVLEGAPPALDLLPDYHLTAEVRLFAS